jgi:hypothetical protein
MINQRFSTNSCSKFSEPDPALSSPKLLTSPLRSAVRPMSLSILSLRAESSAAKRTSPEPNSSSISSSVRPLVSGTKKNTQATPIDVITPKNMNAPNWDTLMNGEVEMATAKLFNQLELPPSATPFARSPRGKTSEIMIHATGPHE